MFGTVNLAIKLEATIKQDGDSWIACCTPLDLLTQSDSKESALELLSEAVSLWFESCMERNVLKEALEEAGFTRCSTGQSIPRHANRVDFIENSKSQFEKIEVSIPAYIAAAMGTPAHAAR